MNTLALAQAAVRNERTPSDVLDMVYGHHGHDAKVAGLLARHPNASKELVGKLLNHADPVVAAQAAEHKHAKHFYHQMRPELQLYAQAGRHAPREVHDQVRQLAREKFGPVLAKHGWKEVPHDQMPPRSHPGRSVWVHPTDSRMIHVGVMKMGTPYTKKYYWGSRTKYTQAVPVMGWKRFGASDISSPRGSTPESLEKHLERIKKNPWRGRFSGCCSACSGFGVPDVGWHRKLQNFRAVAKEYQGPPAPSPQQTYLAHKGYTESRIDSLLRRAAEVLTESETDHDVFHRYGWEENAAIAAKKAERRRKEQGAWR